jgi:hypothetical protein
MSKVAVVIGMHRSGTSMIARIVNLIGYVLGDEKDLLEADFDNEAGFWENKQFMNINEHIMMTFGDDWDRITVNWEDALYDPRIASYRLKARQLINKFSAYDRWAWKDPRTTVTLPFWQDLLNEFYHDDDVYYIICVRNPLDVAKSLEKRNQFGLQKSLDLWNIYNQCAIRYTRGKKRLIVEYEAFFEDVYRGTERIATFLNESLTSDRLIEIRNSVREDLRHSATTFEAIYENPEIPSATKNLYAVMSSAGDRFLIRALSERLVEPFKESVNIANSIYDVISVQKFSKELPRAVGSNGNRQDTKAIGHLQTSAETRSGEQLKALAREMAQVKQNAIRAFKNNQPEDVLRYSHIFIWRAWEYFQGSGGNDLNGIADEQINNVIKSLALRDANRFYSMLDRKTGEHVGNKIRTVFVKDGVLPNDGPTAVLLTFCRYVNKAKFDVFVVDTASPDTRNVYPNRAIKELKDLGIEYINAESSSYIERARTLANVILSRNCDLLVLFGSVLDVVSRYIVSLNVAKVQVHYDLMRDTGLVDVFDAVIASEEGQLKKHKDKKASVLIKGEPSDMKARLEIAKSAPVLTRESLGVSKDDVLLGTFGRLKKICSNEFISVLVRTLEAFPNVKYLTAGSGDLQERLIIHGIMHRFPGRVIYLGNVGQLEANLLLLLDIYMNSFPLPGGQSFVNALAAGLPFVTMPSFGVATMGCTYGDDISGYPIFNYESRLDDYYNLLAKLITDKSARDYIAELGSSYFSSHLDAKTRIKEFENLWEKMVLSKSTASRQPKEHANV